MFAPFLEAAADVVAEAEDGFVQGIFVLAVAEGDGVFVEGGSDEYAFAEVVIFFHVDGEGNVFVVFDDHFEASFGLPGDDVFLGEVSAFALQLVSEDVFQFVGSHGCHLLPGCFVLLAWDESNINPWG